MVRILSDVPKGDVTTAVDKWVSNHHEWTEDTAEHSMTKTNTAMDGSGTTYVRGDWRFTQEDDQTTLLDDLESRLQAVVDWYRIGYHVCEADEENSADCSFHDDTSEIRKHGTVPSDIPDFN